MRTVAALTIVRHDARPSEAENSMFASSLDMQALLSREGRAALALLVPDQSTVAMPKFLSMAVKSCRNNAGLQSYPVQ